MEILLLLLIAWTLSHPCRRAGSHDWTAPQQAVRWRRTGVYTETQTTVFVRVCTRCGAEKARRPR
jgi:hypothetical protein